MRELLFYFAIYVAGVAAGVVFEREDKTEQQSFMESQQAACESELPADRECVLVFEYVEVGK